MNIKLISKNKDSEPAEIIRQLMGENKLEVTCENITNYLESHEKIDQGDSQAISVMLFLELRKNGVSKDWKWVRGISKKDSKQSVFHSWLEYKDWVIDPMPGFRISGEDILPGNLLIMDKRDYKEYTGFKKMSEKKEKQVLKWIEKVNKKYL